MNIVEAIRHPIGSIGLWQTIQYIFNLEKVKIQDYIIICEDDHEFTKEYNSQQLFECINIAIASNADILVGGPSWVSSICPIQNKVFWMEAFTGLQFTIVFRKFFNSILTAGFSEKDSADIRLGELTNDKYFIYPFFSIQKEFGYSDATRKNNTDGRIESLFLNCDERILLSLKIRQFYNQLPSAANDIACVENVSIPTYIINSPEMVDRREHIEKQFEGRQEFDVTFIEAYKHKIGAVGLWHSIRNVIQQAMENEDDVIIICEDDHEFTPNYSREFLISNIMEAAQQGIDYVSGGSKGFGSAIPVTKNRFWVSSMLSTQFLIVFKNFFPKILEEPFDNEVKADLLLSELTPNKMLLCPFISIQKDFGYSDASGGHNSISGVVNDLYQSCQKRLSNIGQSCSK